MDKFCRGWFRSLTCRGSVPWRNRTSPASGTSVGWQPTGRLKMGQTAVRPKVQRGRRRRCATLGSAMRVRAWPKELMLGIQPPSVPLLLHRSQGGLSSSSPSHTKFGSRFSSCAGSNQRKGAEGARCAWYRGVLGVPIALGAPKEFRAPEVRAVLKELGAPKGHVVPRVQCAPKVASPEDNG